MRPANRHTKIYSYISSLEWGTEWRKENIVVCANYVPTEGIGGSGFDSRRGLTNTERLPRAGVVGGKARGVSTRSVDFLLKWKIDRGKERIDDRLDWFPTDEK